jgi:acyl-CoA thioesterase FadM
VTARIEVSYRKPVPVGSRLELEGRVDRIDGRKIWTSLEGRVDGVVAVEARAMYLKVGLNHFIPHAQRMGERMSDRPYNP